MALKKDVAMPAQDRSDMGKKETNESECIRVRHVWETNYFNSVVHVSPVTVAA